MLNKEEIEYIESKINYSFNDKSLLSRAFTHPSFDNDVNKNYETLEFLGDSIVDFVVAEKLLLLHPKCDEGSLTKMRINLVSEKHLANAIEQIRISEKMIFGIGENRTKIYKHSSIQCDLFESITGAIYLDSNMNNAKKFVLSLLESQFDDVDIKDDYKSLLNEYEGKNSVKVEYKMLSNEGPSHKPTFVFSVLIGGVEYGVGKGTTKQSAQQEAAKVALSKL